MRAWLGFGALRDPAKVRPWLYCILRAVLADACERDGRRQRLVSITRLEDETLLRGEGRFIDDLDPVPNACYAAVLRSQLAHGRTLADQPSYELAPSPTANATQIRQTFTFEQFYQFQLPAAYQPVSLDLAGERLRYDANTGVLFDTNGTHPGFTYTVTSELAAPTTTQLEGDDPALAQNASFYEQLPSNLPREITTIAQSLVRGKTSIFDQIEAIKSYLRTFTYSTSVKAGHSANDRTSSTAAMLSSGHRYSPNN